MKDKIHLRANFTILAIFVSVIMTSITIISQIYLPDTTTDIIRASSLMAGGITLTSLIGFQFIHGGLIHLVLNCSGLIGIGSLLEKSIGTKNYMYLFVISTALIVASAMVFYQPNVRLIGISGFVFAILGFLIPFVYRIGLGKPLGVFLIIAVVSEIPFMFITPGVSALAHISGFIAGLLGFLTFNWRYGSNFFIHTKTLVTQVKELGGTLDREIPLAVRTMVSIYDK